VRLGFVRFSWLVLALLAAFVIFVECMADAGGDAAPIEQPTPTAATRGE
jgi:hypothetical protein